MGFLDKLFGREEKPRHSSGGMFGQGQGHPQQGYPQGGQQPRYGAPPRPAASEDDRAVARYTYLLRTAPPEQLERVHAEAFEQLTPEQRQQVLGRLSQDLPPGEAPTTDNPQDLARAATRAEMRQPGYMQRSFAGPGLGSMMAGSMLGTIAGVVIGSAIAQSLFGGYESSPEAAGVGEDTGAGADGGDAGGEGGEGGDAGGEGGEAGGTDSGGDFGADAGGDFGAGDFGGGVAVTSAVVTSVVASATSDLRLLSLSPRRSTAGGGVGDI